MWLSEEDCIDNAVSLITDVSVSRYSRPWSSFSALEMDAHYGSLRGQYSACSHYTQAPDWWAQ